MQVTAPPAPVWWELERWRRRGVRGGGRGSDRSDERSGRQYTDAALAQLHLRELQRLRDLHALFDRQRLALPDILLYAPSRLGGAESQAQPTVSWRHRPLWHQPDFVQPPVRQRESRGPGTIGAAEGWSALRGWAAGALLVLGALLLLRAADRCLARAACRVRRRRSEEWPAASVLATSQMDMVQPNIADVFHSESSESSNEPHNADLPPPYSECASDSNKEITTEEPPPPYSGCYVSYSNPGGGNNPFIQIYCLDEIPATHINIAPVDGVDIAHSSNSFNHIDTGQTSTDTEPVTNTVPEVVTVPNASTGKMAPLATEDMSIDSDDASASTNRNSTC